MAEAANEMRPHGLACSSRLRMGLWIVQVVPRTIAENSGLNATEAVALLHAAHANGQVRAGLDIETGQPSDLAEQGIVDVYSTKW